MCRKIIKVEEEEKYGVVVRGTWCVTDWESLKEKENSQDIGKIARIISYGINGCVVIEFVDGTRDFLTWWEFRPIDISAVPYELRERFKKV